MARLDRQYCDICNKVLPSMGYYRLEDGSICSACSKLISPFLNNRKEKSADYIKRHIEYRQENKKKLSSFRPSIGFGFDKKIYIDPYMSGFVVTKRKEDEIILDNPDIIPLSQVVSCDTNIREYKKEEYKIGENGRKESYFPPHITFYYDFKVEIVIDSEWFDKIVIDLNGESIEGRGSVRYQKCTGIAKQLKDTLMVDKKRMPFEVQRSENHLFRL